MEEKINKYMQKYALPSWNLEISGTGKYKLIIVVPAICEFENIQSLLNSLRQNNPACFSQLLIIFVINNTSSADNNVRIDNIRTIDFLRNVISKNSSDKFAQSIISSGLQIAIIDASSFGKELPEKIGGVGLARKIGMDIALEYFDYGHKGKNILGCLDADCTVSQNYLEEVIGSFNSKGISAAHVNFLHPLPEETEAQKAIICYEIFLRYYVLGLKTAGSSYAFHTIGSTMFCDAEAYIRVQGMNKRKAAEDFYFMEKLSKICKIENINSAVVYPSGRSSWRVPFGTGQRVNRYLRNTQDEYLLYSPKSFSLLKDWLEIFHSHKILSSDEYLSAAEKISKYLREFLEINSFEKSWNKILKNSNSDRQVNKQKILWFDGFRTLKLIHFLRDTIFPNEHMFDVLDEMFSLYKSEVNYGREKWQIPELKKQLLYLDKLRELA